MSERYFTKVYEKPRSPLKCRPFLHALDDVIISDVAFALTGKRPETESGDGIAAKQKKENTK